MANPEHVHLLQQGASVWNKWREDNPGVKPDLSNDEISDFESSLLILSEAVANEVMPGQAPAMEGELAELDLSRVDLSGANLARANLSRSTFILANLAGADLSGANFSGCILTSARLQNANFEKASLNGAILRFANLENANLDSTIMRLANLDQIKASNTKFRNADFSFASINEANLSGADISGAFVYGISAWNVQTEGIRQNDLRITRTNEGVITVDDIKIAQFVYTLINNQNVRDAIETLTTKLVLILGRFKSERKTVLDGIKAWLHQNDYVPVIFDFDRPVSRDLTETVVALAHMARFIIADLTEPASIAKELEAIVPGLAVPVQPLIVGNSEPYAMFKDYWKYDWVLKLHRYNSLEGLLEGFNDQIIQPVEQKTRQLILRRAKALEK